MKPAQSQGDQVLGVLQSRAQDIPCLWVPSCWVQKALLSAKCVLNIAFTKRRFLCECVGYKFYCNPCVTCCHCCLAYQATPPGYSFPAFPHCSVLLFYNLGSVLQESLHLRRRLSFACAGDSTGVCFSFPYCNRVVKGG